jgi:hypothetical protein
MSKKNTKQVEAAKTSKTNQLDKLNDKLLDLYNEAVDTLDDKYMRYGQPSYKEIKAKINKARRNGRLYETTDRNAAFKYIATMRYTADMIAKYDGCRGYIEDREGNITTRDIRICVTDIYLYIRETEECIHLVNHEWFNTELCKWEVIKYYLQYGNIVGGIVYMPFLKGLKYAEAYKKNFGPDKAKYQIVTASKKERVEYVQKKLRVAGLNLSYDYIRKHLNEL